MYSQRITFTTKVCSFFLSHRHTIVHVEIQTFYTTHLSTNGQPTYDHMMERRKEVIAIFLQYSMNLRCGPKVDRLPSLDYLFILAVILEYFKNPAQTSDNYGRKSRCLCQQKKLCFSNECNCLLFNTNKTNFSDVNVN